jgi:hypothetical protein
MEKYNIKKGTDAINITQSLLTEQMSEFKQVLAAVRKSGDNEHFGDMVKMWLRLAKDLKRQGDKIKACAAEVRQDVKKEPKPLQDFQSKLTDGQIRELLPLINKYVFVEKQTTNSVNEWLRCKNKEPLQVKSNGLLAFLLNVLQAYDFICRNCQKVAADNKTFVSMRGKVLNQKDLSKAQSKLAQKVGYKKEERDIYAINSHIYNKVRELSLKKHFHLS